MAMFWRQIEMKNVNKDFGIPKGLTGKPSKFVNTFKKRVLEKYGFHIRKVKIKTPMMMANHYWQYSVDTIKGEFIVGNSLSDNQPLIYYKGDGKWDGK